MCKRASFIFPCAWSRGGTPHLCFRVRADSLRLPRSAGCISLARLSADLRHPHRSALCCLVLCCNLQCSPHPPDAWIVDLLLEHLVGLVAHNARDVLRLSGATRGVNQNNAILQCMQGSACERVRERERERDKERERERDKERKRDKERERATTSTCLLLFSIRVAPNHTLTLKSSCGITLGC